MARKTIEDLVGNGIDQEALDAIRGIAGDIGEAIWAAAHTASRTVARDEAERVADKLILFAMDD